jgi:hypothetical protein
MGDFVRLKGWKKYAGGLDTESAFLSLFRVLFPLNFPFFYIILIYYVIIL